MNGDFFPARSGAGIKPERGAGGVFKNHSPECAGVRASPIIKRENIGLAITGQVGVWGGVDIPGLKGYGAGIKEVIGVHIEVTGDGNVGLLVSELIGDG